MFFYCTLWIEIGRNWFKEKISINEVLLLQDRVEKNYRLMTMKDWVGRVNETIFENKGFHWIFIEVTEFPIIYKVSNLKIFI